MKPKSEFQCNFFVCDSLKSIPVCMMPSGRLPAAYPHFQLTLQRHVLVHNTNEYWFRAIDNKMPHYFRIEAINEKEVSAGRKM